MDMEGKGAEDIEMGGANEAVEMGGTNEAVEMGEANQAVEMGGANQAVEIRGSTEAVGRRQYVTIGHQGKFYTEVKSLKGCCLIRVMSNFDFLDLGR